MSDSWLNDRVRRVLIEEWDILMMMAFFVFLIYHAIDLSAIPRQFPLLFLVFGLVAMTIELAVHLLPPKYGTPIKRLTTGIAAEFDEAAIDQQEDESEEDEKRGDQKLLAWTLLLVISFGVLSFYISFLLALPIFVFATMYVVGSGNMLHAAITTIALFLLMYFVFAELMNVPIDRGVLIGAEDFIP